MRPYGHFGRFGSPGLCFSFFGTEVRAVSTRAGSVWVVVDGKSSAWFAGLSLWAVLQVQLVCSALAASSFRAWPPDLFPSFLQAWPLRGGGVIRHCNLLSPFFATRENTHQFLQGHPRSLGRCIVWAILRCRCRARGFQFRLARKKKRENVFGRRMVELWH